jgi:hypothetical protein
MAVPSNFHFDSPNLPALVKTPSLDGVTNTLQRGYYAWYYAHTRTHVAQWVHKLLSGLTRAVRIPRA